MKSKSITGTVQWVDLATGFWCITDSRQRQWRLTGEIPDALKQSGLRVKAVVSPVEEGFSIFMAGTPVKVLSFDML